MSLYANASKFGKYLIRKEMLVQAEKALDGLYASKAKQRVAARIMVDTALAKERLTAEAGVSSRSSAATAR